MPGWFWIVLWSLVIAVVAAPKESAVGDEAMPASVVGGGASTGLVNH